MSKTEALPVAINEKTQVTTNLRLIGGIVALTIGVTAACVAFKTTQEQQGRDLADLKTNFVAFQEATNKSLAKIEDTQEAHFEKLLDRIDSIKNPQARAYPTPTASATH